MALLFSARLSGFLIVEKPMSAIVLFLCLVLGYVSCINKTIPRVIWEVVLLLPVSSFSVVELMLYYVLVMD